MAQHPAFLLIDRTAVLFCGVAAGIAIGMAFAPQLHGLLGDAPPAQTVTAPAAAAGDAMAARPLPAGMARAVADGRPFRIGVFGDSFGDGLWAALYNQLPRKEAFQVLRYSQQATGFTRYRQTNLEEMLAAQLAEGPVDVAVISFGANDTQGLLLDGRLAPLLSPRWQAEIERRITRYVGALRAQGADVVWVGLPVMRDPGFDAQVQGLNAFHARMMAQLKVPFIDTRGAAAGPDGAYASHLPDKATGAPWLVRAGDGIHMSMKGYRLLTDSLASRIRAWGVTARNGRAVTPDLVPPPPPEPVLEPIPQGPLGTSDPYDPPPAEAQPDPAADSASTPPTDLLPDDAPPPAAPPSDPAAEPSPPPAPPT